MATLRELEQRLKVHPHLITQSNIPVHPQHRENHKDNENRRKVKIPRPTIRFTLVPV